MTQLLSTDIPPVPHQWSMADASKPFDTVVMMGKDTPSKQIETLQEAAQKAAKEGKNTLIIGDGKSDIPTNYTGLLQGKINGNTQIILCGHGSNRENYHSIDVVEGQEDIAHTVKDIVSISGESPPRRVFVYSCRAEAAKANFLKTHSPVEVILDGSNHTTLVGLNLEAIYTLISGGSLPHLPLEGDVNQHALYDHVTVIENGKVTTHTPIDLSTMVYAGLASGGAPQIPAMEILQKRLLLAATRGNTTEVQQLLDLGVDPNKARDLLGFTALHLAANYGHPCATKVLLKYNAHPDAKDNVETTPLHYATIYGHSAVVKELLEHGAHPDAKDNVGATPLHYAVRYGCLEIVQVLLTHGANPNLPNNQGRTPECYLEFVEDPETKAAIERMLEQQTEKTKVKEMCTAATEGNAAVVKKLLDCGVSPDAKDQNGDTALHLAAAEGNTAVVKVLLEHGAHPNIQTQSGGNTALHLAITEGHLAVVEALLAKGANPHALNNQGFTPKDYLEHVEDPATKAAIERLLEQQTEKVREMCTAATEGNATAVKKLLDCGVSPHAKDNIGTPALHLAAEGGYSIVAGILLEHGADPDVSIKPGGNTALHFAIRRPHPTVVKALLKHGANPHALNDQGHTPKDYLVHVKDPATKAAIERLLEQAEKKWQKEHPTATLDDVNSGGITYKSSERAQNNISG